MRTRKLVADPKKPYKAIYAFVLATITAATGVWVGNPYLTMALAVVTALGTYFVPNPITTQTDVTADRPDGPVTITHPDTDGTL